MDNIKFGKMAEDCALRLLEKKGWTLIDRHVCFREGEIDLIVGKDERLLFVEVKARRTEVFGAVVEALTTGKIRKLKKAVMRWRMQSNERRSGQLYFIGILFDGERPVKVDGYFIE